MDSEKEKSIAQWMKHNKRKYQQHIATSEVLKKNSVELVKILTDNNILSNGIKIFEIGCGSGRNLSYINKEGYDIKYFGNDLIKIECFEYMDCDLKEKINFIEQETSELFNSIYEVDLFISSDHLMHLPPSSVIGILDKINNNWKPRYILLREIILAAKGRKRKWVHDYSIFDNNYECIYKCISEQNSSYPIILLKRK